MMKTGFIATLTALLCGCATTSTSQVEQLAMLMEGRFDTHAPGASAPPKTRLVDTRIRVIAPAFGDVVFYSQINMGDSQKVYRQRLLVFEQTADGLIQQSAFSFKTPERFVDGNANELAKLLKTDVEASLHEGCRQMYQQAGKGFYGRVNPDTCIITSSRTGKLRAIEGEAMVMGDRLRQAERGFDPETGEQLFGTEAGVYYELLRVEP